MKVNRQKKKKSKNVLPLKNCGCDFPVMQSFWLPEQATGIQNKIHDNSGVGVGMGKVIECMLPHFTHSKLLWKLTRFPTLTATLLTSVCVCVCVWRGLHVYV